MLKRWPGIASIVVVLTILGASIAYAQQTVSITASEFAFDSATYTVQAGEEVQFEITNTGQFPHDVRIEGQGVTFEAVPGDANVAPGQSATASFTFNTPGTYQMWCPVPGHRQQGMEASFVVTAAAAATPSTAAPAPTPSTVAPAATATPSTAAPSVAAPTPTPSTAAPATLPRTGGFAIPAGLAVIGSGMLIGLGWLARRRGTTD